MAGAGGGFAGAGAGAQAFQQGLGGLKSDIARRRRGVVEGFQSDLLSAVSDIEQKGEFEFGGKGGGVDEFEDKIQDYMNNSGMTREEAEQKVMADWQAHQDKQGGSGTGRS